MWSADCPELYRCVMSCFHLTHRTWDDYHSSILRFMNKGRHSVPTGEMFCYHVDKLILTKIRSGFASLWIALAMCLLVIYSRIQTTRFRWGNYRGDQYHLIVEAERYRCTCHDMSILGAFSFHLPFTIHTIFLLGNPGIDEWSDLYTTVCPGT